MGSVKGKRLGFFDSVYIGSPFCQNIFPSQKNIKELFSAGAKKISIMTSFMTDTRLKEVGTRLSGFIAEGFNIEILLNDLGLLSVLNKRHPGVLKGISMPLSMEFLRMKPEKLEDFMTKNKLSSIETDEASLVPALPKDRSFSINFHRPFRFMGLQRNCAYFKKTGPDCAFQCFGKKMKLKAPGRGNYLFALSNAYFVKGKYLTPRGVDRLVDWVF